MVARFIAPALLAAAVLAATPATAQFGGSLMRMQTNMTERAISRNLDRIFKPKLVIAEGATGPVTALGLSADEHYLVTAVGNDTVRVWDLFAGREIARLSGHKARVTAIAIARDGSRAVTVGEDRSIKLWNLKTFAQMAELGGKGAAATDIAFDPAGRRLLAATADGHLQLFAMPDGKLVRDIAAHAAGATRAAFTADGATVVSAGADGAIRLFDAASGDKRGEIAAGAPVTSLAVGGGLIAAGTGGGVRLWSADGTAQGSLDSGSVTGIAFKGGDGLVMGDGDGKLTLWNFKSGERKTLGRHDKAITGVAVNQKGDLALSAGEDGSTRLWNLGNGAALLQLISTQKGWAVVDAKGRYDGNEQGLDGIEWQAPEVTAKVEDFAETHYQANLLARSVAGGADVPDATNIPEGARYPAAVRFVSPGADVQEPQSHIDVEVAATEDGGGLSELRLYRNGKLVPPPSGGITRREVDGKAELVGHYTLDLGPGLNVLSAVAVNADRLESRPKRIVVNGGADRGVAGKLHVVVVGINKYAASALQLGYTRPNAESIGGYLAAAGHTPMPVAEVIRLTDEQATKANILATLRQLHGIPPEDVVVLYLAGHGVSLGDKWYFISQEVQIPHHLDELAGVALSAGEIEDELEALPAERTLMLIDTCQSGSAVNPLSDYRGMKSLRLLARTVGSHVLAATDRSQFAIETQSLGHGVFTYVLLQALGGKAAGGDGLVTATDLIRYVEDEVPRLVSTLSEDPQYPTGYSHGVDFTVAGNNR